MLESVLLIQTIGQGSRTGLTSVATGAVRDGEKATSSFILPA
jgi:hypothetical protein